MVNSFQRPESSLMTARNTDSINVMRNLMAIFALLVFLGFPGTLSKVVGSGVAKMMEYGAFGIQFVLVMMSTSDDVFNIKLINLQPAYGLLYIYVFYVLADSAAVSINRKTALVTVVHLLLTVMFAIWLLEQYDMEELLELLYSAQFIFVATTMISIVIFPKVAMYSYHGSKTLRGLFATKNECGTELSFGILVQTILLRMRLQQHQRISLIFLGMIAAQFGMILLTKNMGAILITVSYIGYILYYTRQRKKKRLPLGMMFIVITVGFLFFALTILQALEPLLNSLGKDASLTGRVPLWEQTITVMSNHKTLTGYGYEMFWKTPSAVNLFHSGFDENSWAGSLSASTHNMMMEMWANTGLLGVAFYYLMYVVADRGVKHLQENQYLFASAFIVMFSIRSLTERQTDPSSIYALFSYVVLGMMYQAKYRHRIESAKKVRIYVDLSAGDETEEEKEEVRPDWTAFQEHSVRTPARISSRRVQQREEDEEEDEEMTELNALFESLDGDNDKDLW